jgi:hypothetical protein
MKMTHLWWRQFLCSRSQRFQIWVGWLIFSDDSETLNWFLFKAKTRKLQYALKARASDTTRLKKLNLDENDSTVVVAIFMFPDPEVRNLSRLIHFQLRLRNIKLVFVQGKN